MMRSAISPRLAMSTRFIGGRKRRAGRKKREERCLALPSGTARRRGRVAEYRKQAAAEQIIEPSRPVVHQPDIVNPDRAALAGSLQQLRQRESLWSGRGDSADPTEAERSPF